MTWVNTIAETNYSSGRLAWIGGGDADVYTKPGRSTRVNLRADNIRPSDDWRAVLVDVEYTVTEMRQNNTMLQWRGTARLPIPADARSHRIQVMDVRGYDRSWIVRGQQHDYLEVPGIGTAVIRDGTYRIDGAGDDQTNAQIDLQLEVPIRYDDAA